MNDLFRRVYFYCFISIFSLDFGPPPKTKIILVKIQGGGSLNTLPLRHVKPAASF